MIPGDKSQNNPVSGKRRNGTPEQSGIIYAETTKRRRNFKMENKIETQTVTMAHGAGGKQTSEADR